MKDYYSKKEAKLVETGKVYEAVISLKEIEEMMQYMEDTVKKSITVFTVSRTGARIALIASILSLGCSLVGYRGILLAGLAIGCAVVSTAIHLLGKKVLPCPSGMRHLETALRLQEILRKEDSLDSLKISTSGLLSICTTEGTGTRPLFEEYLKVEYACQDHIVVESYIERENTSRNKPALGYDIKITLPLETQNER